MNNFQNIQSGKPELKEYYPDTYRDVIKRRRKQRLENISVDDALPKESDDEKLKGY